MVSQRTTFSWLVFKFTCRPCLLNYIFGGVLTFSFDDIPEPPTANKITLPIFRHNKTHKEWDAEGRPVSTARQRMPRPEGLQIASRSLRHSNFHSLWRFLKGKVRFSLLTNSPTCSRSVVRCVYPDTKANKANLISSGSELNLFQIILFSPLGKKCLVPIRKLCVEDSLAKI